MNLLRPAKLSDIGHIERIAHESGDLVCTLPNQREHLLQKIERSIASFEQEVWSPGQELYFFVLEESMTGQILGTGAINALAGFREPFYAFRNDILIHSSRELKIHNRIHALTLTHDLSDHSQLSSFFIIPSLKNTDYPSLITLGRLLFMSVQSHRFTNEWMAVMPGVADAKGHAPFWEHVGRKFFGIDYSQVEYYNGTRDKTFIAELMPHYPLYVPLIDGRAQEVMGQVHPDAELQFNLLTEQGFEADKYVEIFDAGPIVTVSPNVLPIWRKHKEVKIKLSVTNDGFERVLIGAQTKVGFCAVIANGKLNEDEVWVEASTLEQLGLDGIDDQALSTIWCFSLDS